MDLLKINNNMHIGLLNTPWNSVVKNESDIMLLNLQELGVIKNKGAWWY
jgi:hypothetical protein